VHVTVTTANTRALGFYHRLGFRPLEIAPPEITEPGEVTVTYLGRKL
jgi:ribosomal protein S18 acetylase RimI-like enzyme